MDSPVGWSIPLSHKDVVKKDMAEVEVTEEDTEDKTTPGYRA